MHCGGSCERCVPCVPLARHSCVPLARHVQCDEPLASMHALSSSSSRHQVQEYCHVGGRQHLPLRLRLPSRMALICLARDLCHGNASKQIELITEQQCNSRSQIGMQSVFGPPPFSPYKNKGILTYYTTTTTITTTTTTSRHPAHQPGQRRRPREIPGAKSRENRGARPPRAPPRRDRLTSSTQYWSR
jgi:hypothetical protein